jgi:hypothetical protein
VLDMSRRFQTAWDGVGVALSVIAREHAEFDDIISIDTTDNADRVLELVELCTAADRGGHLRLGRTLTLTRRLTGGSLCIAIGLSDLPAAQDELDLLSWQYGIWVDDIPGKFGRSPVQALSPETASLLVLEELRETAQPFLAEFITEAGMTNRAFVSYVREDSAAVDRLCVELNNRGVGTWTDRTDLSPGARWKEEIRSAIQSGSAFIACFSTSYEAKSRSYMNEELTIAVEELRLRPRDRAWFFPVLLDSADVPAIPIAAGETLRDLQSVSLADQGEEAVKRLAKAVRGAARDDDAVVFEPPSEA